MLLAPMQAYARTTNLAAPSQTAETATGSFNPTFGLNYINDLAAYISDLFGFLTEREATKTEAQSVAAILITNIFSENIGTGTGTQTIAATTFQNSGTLTYSSGGATNPADTRDTSVSSGYAGASGGKNVFFTSTSGQFGFSIESINASANTNLALSFAVRKEGSSGTAFATFTADYWNGSAWVSVPLSGLPTIANAAGWYLISGITLPVGAQINGLKIRFVKTGTIACRLDDIILQGDSVSSSAPTITTPTAASITNNSAVLGANVTADGGSAITERGTVWRNFTGVTIADNKLAEGGTTTGIFSHTRTLPAGTQIYYKGYAINAVGTTLSSESSFYTLSNEPTSHAATFSAVGTSPTQITLSFPAASTIPNAAGYVILRRADAAFPDATGITDATQVPSIPTAGTTRAAIISNPSQAGLVDTGVSVNTTYKYAIIPFGYNGNDLTYNYLTTPTIPTAQATTKPNDSTAVSVTAVSGSSVNVAWTQAAGYSAANHSTLVFVKQASAVTQGTPTNSVASYTANTVFGSGTPFQNDASAFCVFKGDGTSVAVTGLNPSTFYHVLIYNVVDASTIYSLGATANGSTVKGEPTNHPTSFAAGTVSTNNIPLTWVDAVGGQVPDGYLVKSSSTSLAAIAPPVDGVVESGINTAQGIQATNFGGAPNTTYYFKIFPYTNNGTLRDYKTDGTIQTVTAATASTSSDVVAVAASESATISSLINDASPLTTATGAQVWQITIRDGGATADADNLPTIVNSLTVRTATTGNTVADWSNAILAADLFDGATRIAGGVVSTSQISFNFLTVTAPDDGTKTLTLRISLKTSGLTDNQKFALRLQANDILVASTGSSQKNTVFTTATSDATKNVINVLATKLAFVQQPTSVTANTAMAPSPTIQATDANNNRDLDYITPDVSITATGATLTGSPRTATPSAGLATITSPTFTTTGTGVTLTATSDSLAPATSSAFNVTADPATLQYRSKTSGNWNAATTWESSSDNGTNWVDATTTPTSTNSTVTILNGHTVTVTASISVDEVTVNTGGQVIVNSSQTLTVANGAGTDLTVNGVINNAGTISQTGASLAFGSGSKYVHALDGGTIPTAAWNSNSTIEITGTITNAPNFSSSATYGNVTWNAASQGSSALNLTGGLINVAGNFTVQSTGASGQVRFFGSTTNATVTIGGDLIIQGGELRFSNGSALTSAISLGGSYNQTGGTFDGDASGSMTFAFTGTNKTFTQSAGTLTNSDINWTINSGASLTLNNNLPVATGRAAAVNGTLNTGTKGVTGAGAFTLGATGTLGLGGAIGVETGSAGANIQVTGLKTFNSGSTVIFNGSANQSAGANFPPSVTNLTIINTGGAANNTVTGAANQTVTGLLRVQQGIYAGTNHTTGFFQGVTIENNATLTVASNGLLNDRGNWDNSGIFTANGGTVDLSGAAGQTISGNTTFFNLAKTTSAEQTLTFAAGSTTTVTNMLTLSGAPAQLLTLHSSSDGTQWNLVAPFAQSVNYVYVQDSNAVNGATVRAANSVSTGNNINWSFSPGTISFSGAPYADSETNANHSKTITVQRTGGIVGAVAVSYATTNGTAAAGSDYTTTSGTLSWADGDFADKTFTIPVTGDTTHESDETISITLSSATNGAIIGGTNPATLTITNDDAAPTLSINDVNVSEGDSGTTAFTFTVTKSGATELASQVNYATADGATSPAAGGASCVGADYLSASGTLNFTAAQTQQTVIVNVCGDTSSETDETFFVNLSIPTGASISDNQGLGMILNDDTANNINVSLPTNLTVLTNTVLTIPVTVSDTTGNSSYSFNISYNQSIISPAAVPYHAAGTLSSGSSITPDTSTPGVLGITANGALSGAGTLIELKFNVIGAPPNCTSLSFTSFTFDNANAVVSGAGGMCVRTGNIGGRITYGTSAMLQPVRGVTVNAAGLPNLSATTDADGLYNLSGFGSGAYTLTPSKTGDVSPATFSGFDASLAARHAVGIINLDSNQRIAADASGNGTITSFDASLIAQYVVGITLNQPNQTGIWKFVQPGKSYTNIWTDYPSEDFTAVLKGDVSGSWTPSGRRVVEDKSLPNQVRITIAGSTVTAGDEIVIPINISDVTNRGVYSFDFEIQFDAGVFEIDEDNMTALAGTEEEVSAQTDFAGILSMPSFVEKTDALSQNYSFAVKRTAKGVLKITGYGVVPLEGAGELLRLKFRAKKGAATAKSRISWSAAGLNEGNEIPVLTEGAIIVIKQPVE
jgi:hypothetical protein